MNIRNIVLTIIMLAISATLSAQKKPAETKIEDLPQRPIDTIPTADKDTKIILYSNNTWSYYRPSLEDRKELPVYTNHWDTTGVFAYKDIAYEALPPTVELKLVNSLSEFKSPIKGKVFSKYGIRNRKNHNGIDIPLKKGEPIYATFEGKVRYAKFNSGGFGYLVILRHPNGLETWHAHLSRLNVAVDEYVKAGQVIGFGGNTGRSRGAHLHFEMRYQDQSFDPEFIIDFEAAQLKYQTFALEKSFFNIRSRASEILDEDDEYDIPLLASAIGGDTTSVDILDIIARAQNSDAQKAKPAVISQGTAVYHTVKSGDMLGKIAVRYGVSINQICQLNNITRTTILKLGRKLRVK